MGTTITTIITLLSLLQVAGGVWYLRGQLGSMSAVSVVAAGAAQQPAGCEGITPGVQQPGPDTSHQQPVTSGQQQRSELGPPPARQLSQHTATPTNGR